MPDLRNLPRWLRNSALTIAALALLLTGAGASYQSIEARTDARRFYQRGKSVDIGGYKLILNCTGEGSPTVVLESGLEFPGTEWRLVQPDISRFTRVCSYDRAGYGWSDPGPTPRTLAQIARELHALLERAGEKPPYVLVGHSFGAGDVRLYNELYPTEVAGMILAESGADGVIPPASILQLMEANLKDRQRSRELAPIRFRLGISRFLIRKEINDRASPYEVQEWWYHEIQPKFVAATTSEVESTLNGEDTEELKGAGTLGDKPLTVLIAEKGFGPPLTSQDWVDYRNKWVEGQKQLAQKLSSRGKWLIVNGSGHMIPSDRPDVIVNAAKEVFGATYLH